ncbi:MAG TPA: M23 family metallopeptidase [Propionibacteriaceae bacterium]|nr:M23 family metallopeptidase [Propionibacteriaceae bacterium]
MPEKQRPEHATLVKAIRAAAAYRPDPDRPPVVLSLPFTGSWLALNTPARRVPSHGTHFLGQTFAIDFVAVDADRRTATVRDWRTVLALEPADRFLAFGQPILAPVDGQVVAVHDGEPDHLARRSPLTLLSYAVTQGSRLRSGLNSIVGNHVILALNEEGPFVVLAHLREGSLQVDVGDKINSRQPIATCGNSGNSTQPHVHVQVMDSTDQLAARGLPMAFRDYVAWPREGTERHVNQGIPGHRERVAPVSG